MRQDIYSEHLAELNGVNFTCREIDVVACLLGARGTSRTASLLSISPRTVVSHMRNIMLKLDCNSRERILDFVEESGKVTLLRQHYTTLLANEVFEKSLKEVFCLKNEHTPNNLIFLLKDPRLKKSILNYLEAHLNMVDIQATVKEDHDRLYLLINDADDKSFKIESVDLEDKEDYYLAFFDILRKLFQNSNLEKIILDFQKQYEVIQGLADPIQSLTRDKGRKVNGFTTKTKGLLQGKWFLMAASFFTIVVMFGSIFLAFKENDVPNFNKSKKASEEFYIRADLNIPMESVLLERPKLLEQIENKFKKQKGIKTVALIGIGGAGKTTLARQYAQSQKSSIIWEVNAKTSETLSSSFTKLAYALAKTEENKKILQSLQKIKNPFKREQIITQFVREQLKLHDEWFIIYDNVEKFTDIRERFPQDLTTWGQGKIILTTCNSNIQNSECVKDVFFLGELNDAQKINLFLKIMGQGEKKKFSLEEIEEIRIFIKEISPFPLDISISANYIKATNTSYKKYLMHLRSNNDEFASIQEDLLRHSGHYSKTRHNIISWSLKNLLNMHEDFAGLLLLMSLLDSQDIPKTLLSTYRSEAIVDNFIYNLKKYSFIANESPNSPLGPTFSIHRSTQASSLLYFRKIEALRNDKKLIQSLSKALEIYASDIVDSEDFAKMKLLTSHCEAFLSHKTLLTKPIEGSIGGELGGLYYHQAHYQKAREILTESFEKFNKQTHPRTARILTYLGNVYRELGKFEKAKSFLEQSLSIYKKSFSEHKISIARNLGYLGIVYRDLNNNKKAKYLLNQSLLLYKKHFPEKHVDIARNLGYLGHVYMSLGDYKRAISLFEQSLLIYRKHIHDNHFGITRNLTSLANAYRELGEYKEAKNMIGQSFVIYKKHFSKNNTEIAWTLAHLQKNLNNNKKANFEIAVALRSLGQIYFLEGHLEAAENVFQKALKLFTKNSHPDRYTCLEALAEVNYKKFSLAKDTKDLHQFKRFKMRAISCLKRAEKIVKNSYSNDSSHIKRIQSKLKMLGQG